VKGEGVIYNKRGEGGRRRHLCLLLYEEIVAMLDHASEEILTCLTATCHSEMIQR
jgi:hypothetical protein